MVAGFSYGTMVRSDLLDNHFLTVLNVNALHRLRHFDTLKAVNLRRYSSSFNVADSQSSIDCEGCSLVGICTRELREGDGGHHAVNLFCLGSQELKLTWLHNLIVCSLNQNRAAGCDEAIVSCTFKPQGKVIGIQFALSYRQLQRAYVDFLGLSINPNELNKATSTTAHRSDAIIYLEQHLDKLEQYLQQQPNTPHYKNLKLRVKKIREKYESAK